MCHFIPPPLHNLIILPLNFIFCSIKCHTPFIYLMDNMSKRVHIIILQVTGSQTHIFNISSKPSAVVIWGNMHQHLTVVPCGSLHWWTLELILSTRKRFAVMLGSSSQLRPAETDGACWGNHFNLKVILHRETLCVVFGLCTGWYIKIVVCRVLTLKIISPVHWPFLFCSFRATSSHTFYLTFSDILTSKICWKIYELFGAVVYSVP